MSQKSWRTHDYGADWERYIPEAREPTNEDRALIDRRIQAYLDWRRRQCIPSGKHHPVPQYISVRVGAFTYGWSLFHVVSDTDTLFVNTKTGRDWTLTLHTAPRAHQAPRERVEQRLLHEAEAILRRLRDVPVLHQPIVRREMPTREACLSAILCPILEVRGAP